MRLSVGLSFLGLHHVRARSHVRNVYTVYRICLQLGMLKKTEVSCLVIRAMSMFSCWTYSLNSGANNPESARRGQRRKYGHKPRGPGIRVADPQIPTPQPGWFIHDPSARETPTVPDMHAHIHSRVCHLKGFREGVPIRT